MTRLAERMQETFAALGDSILAHRIVADIYLSEVDYQNTIKTVESALKLLQRKETNTGEILHQ